MLINGLPSESDVIAIYAAASAQGGLRLKFPPQFQKGILV